MDVAKQQLSYQCDQCGSPNIVALSVLYEQGSRTYSSPTYWGSSQSYSAQGAAPPRRKGYGAPFLLWGFLLYFVLFWSWAFYGALAKYPDTTEYALGFLGLMGLSVVSPGWSSPFAKLHVTIERFCPRSTGIGPTHICVAVVASCFIFLHSFVAAFPQPLSGRPDQTHHGETQRAVSSASATKQNVSIRRSIRQNSLVSRPLASTALIHCVCEVAKAAVFRG
jgi:hypothetical protein